MPTGFKLSKIYTAGSCVGRGIFADRTCSWEKVRFDTRCFLLEHPSRGLILIDTGYGKDLLHATRRGVYSLYRTLLPVAYSSEESVVLQLAQDGISLSDLSYLILTHFHPDHIGALPEFAKVPWIYRADALHRLMHFSTLRGLKHGFIRPLVPPIPEGSIPIQGGSFTEEWHGFVSIDLFGDKSLHLVDLPGHALGQMGVAIENTLFAADATWGGEAPPHPLGFLLQENAKLYRKTFAALQNLRVRIIPTHTIRCVKN
jgi:glyoxylase-like metal-dependent hydrolase (beta-lactamase superfamily II)